MAVKNEFALLAQRKFFPFFITQFFGAFNDNLFKNALMIGLIFRASQSSLGPDTLDPDILDPDTLINLCAILFILPFFIFSAFAGQLADKYEKARLIVFIKIADLFLVILAIAGLFLNHLILLLISLFLFGTQATFFSPIKYSILPQHLSEKELLGGNGLVEMGTFIAILLGTILGGLLIAIPDSGYVWVSCLMTLIACLGFISSLFIPKTQIPKTTQTVKKTIDPQLTSQYTPSAQQINAHLSPEINTSIKLDWNVLRQTQIIIKESYVNKKLFYTILAISWFWFYGTLFLTQIPSLTKNNLNANESISTLFLVCFSIGIGFGSTICNWLSKAKVEIGFVILGAVGLSLFAADMAVSTSPAPSIPLNINTFIFYAQNWRLLLDAFWIGCFGGLYLVPLYTLLQKESHPENCSKMIAANNIINSFFMVGASILALAFFNLGFNIPKLFILTALLNMIMVIFLVKLNKLIISNAMTHPSIFSTADYGRSYW